jgi:uncharacterized membrane protein
MATSRRSPARAPHQNPPAKPERDREVIHAGWSGPLPPPGALQQFDEIIPNGAERIMAMVESEQKHRFRLDKAALWAEIVDTIGGKVLGALMTFVAIGAAIYSIMLGAHWAVSVAIVGVPITALIGKFIKSK